MFDKLEYLKGNKIRINGVIKPVKKGYDIHKKLEELRSRHLKNAFAYNELIEKIKNSEQVEEDDFLNLYNEKTNIETDILHTMNLYDIQNKQYKDYKEKCEHDIVSLYQRIHELEQKQMKYHTNLQDIKLIVESKKRIESLKHDIKRKDKITYFILDDTIYDNSNNYEYPEIEEEIIPTLETQEVKNKKHEKSSNEKKGKKTIDKIEKAKEKEAVSISKEKMINIREKAKDRMKSVFKFNNKQECISRAKAVFMSKEQIINEIEKYPELKELFPAKFKSMTKEDICSILFP